MDDVEVVLWEAQRLIAEIEIAQVAHNRKFPNRPSSLFEMLYSVAKYAVDHPATYPTGPGIVYEGEQ